MNVKIKLLRENAHMPLYATETAAAADLYAAIDAPLALAPGCRAGVPTGIAIEPEDSGTVALVVGRSGHGARHGVTLANCVGVIDSDYRGEVTVTLINHGSEPYTVEPGERIAQLMFLPVIAARFICSDELGETVRGAGGFGSTGKQ